MLTPFKLTNYTSRINKVLISITIGIGLGLFLIVSLFRFSFWDIPIGFAGIVPFVFGIVWFLKERKKMGFGVIGSVWTIVLMPIATIPLYGIYLQTLGIFLQACFESLALLFLGSGFFFNWSYLYLF